MTLNASSSLYCNCNFREESQNEYSFYLEAAISTSKQIDEDRLTYLNKGSSFFAAVSNVLKDRQVLSC